MAEKIDLCGVTFVGASESDAVSGWHPLAAIQRSLWFLYKLQPELQGNYNLVFEARCRPAIEPAELRDALAVLVARHSMFRARFSEIDGEPMQTVDDVVPVAVEVVSAFGLSDEELVRMVERERVRPFDVTRAPLMRTQLYARDANECVIVMAFDHIVFDGWSLWHVTQQLGELLSRTSGDVAPEATSPPPDFLQHAAEQRSWLGSRRGQKQLAYWKSVLAEPFPPLALRPDFHVAAGAVERRDTITAVLPPALNEGFRALSERHGLSLFVSFLASYFILLHRLSQQDRVAVGSAMPARSAAWKRTVGNFVNPVVLRSRLRAQNGDATVTVAEFLKATNSVAWGALRNQEYPLAELAERLSPERVGDRQPFFQAFFVFHNPREAADMARILSNTGGYGSVPWGGRVLEAFGRFRSAGSANLDVVLETGDIGKTLWAALDFDARKFSRETAQRFLNAWVAILEGMVSDDGQCVERLSILSAEERRGVLCGSAGRVEEYGLEECVQEVLERQVERAPEATAVIHGTRRISYGELNGRANRLARYLRRMGVGRGTRVGLCVERGLEMVVGIVGTLKAGGAYVPLDPGYPRERLEYMVGDAEPSVILGQGLGLSVARELTANAVIDVGEEGEWGEESDANILVKETGQSSSQVAYVMYTSGSTGAPKGVMVEHRGLVNYTLDAMKWFGLCEGEVVFQQNSLNFDLSVEEVLPALASGATVVVSDEWFGLSMGKQPVRPTLVHLTAAHFHTLVSEWSRAPERAKEELAGVRLLNVTGDALSAEKVAQWEALRPAETQLINTYGPTEATVSCSATYVTHDPQRGVTIGKPFANTQIYILDGERELLPVGVVGELYIGGEQVARGYWKRPELTAERFVRDPFSEKAGARMYRTGDLGRWLTNGEVEFLGRNDQQVKVRGFRIELGEVEARLSSAPGVGEVAVVVAKGEGAEKQVVAYYAGAEAPEAEVLRQYARQALPEYMVPSGMVRLEGLPQTPNGKIDRKALSERQSEGWSEVAREYEAPKGETERRVAGIWSEVLKVERVGRGDNFFELGGHSLLAVTLIERMRRAGLHTDVRTLLLSPTLAEVAGAMGGESGEVEVPPNGIPAGAVELRPEMLPLVKLSEEALERIVRSVRGGAENVQDVYPLAPLQEGILFHHLMEGEGDVYLEATLLGFDSRERVDGFLKALQTVVNRHDILRTAFLWEGLEEPVQVVVRQATLPVEELLLDAGNAAEELERRYDRRKYRIDVTEAPLLRCAVGEDREQGRWLVRLMTHHLATDHVSVELLMEEARRLMKEPSAELGEAAPFRNFVAQARLGEDEEAHGRFFREMLGDVEEPTAPFGLTGVYGDGVEIEESKQKLEGGLAKRLRAQARRRGVSAASVMHLAWAMVLSRVSGRRDVVFGTVLFGRMQGGKNADRTVGLLMNTLPVRLKLEEADAAQSVRTTHALLSELVRHEHARLSLAQRCSRIAAPAALFTALLNYRHSDGARESGELEWEGVVELGAEERSNYPLTLTVDDYGQDVALTAQVSADIGAARVCAYVAQAVENLVTALEADSRVAMCRIDVMPRDEREQVVRGFNATDVEYGEAYLTELFEGQAARLDSAEAVACGQERVGYDELNRRANRLAHHLRSLGVGPDERVALCFERSVEMVVAVLGTLKAGGAYVPLDPAYPRERLEYMLEDSEPAVVLVHGATRELLQGCAVGRRVVDLDDATEWATSPEHDIPRAETGLRPEHLAYVIYTSGTTGQPKGAMNEHRGVVNRIRWMQERYGLKEGEAVIQKTPFSFDVSVWELLWPLTTGARLVMARPEGHRDPSYLREVIQGEQVTTAHFVPSMLQVFLEQESLAGCKSLSRVMCSGEALPAALAARFHARLPGVALHNLYGPTEAAVDVTAWACELGDTRSSVPIGKPIANTRIYVLDEWREPAPVGVVGEVYIAGVQVGRGYWKRPELTAARFVTDPFAEKPEARMYKTGDLARWLPEGALEYLGRNDHQVKVRGFRIELGEIESQLAGVTGISEVVVVARDEGSGDKRLIAYYTGKNAPAAEELRECARRALPEYMVPAAYVQLDALPLSANGKLDRRALPAPDHDALAVSEYEAPRGAIEEALAEIWSRVLKVDWVSRHDDFFALGGHSLLVVQVATQVEKCLSRKVSLGEVFARPVLRDLACALMESAPVDFTAIPVTERSGPLPLSPAQRRLWFLSQFEEASRAYHIHGAVRLGGALDGVTLRRALEHVVTRHEALRTRFVLVGGEPMQVVDGESRFDWREEELRGCADAESLLGELAQRENGAGFDLERGPLLRACLVRMREDEQVLLVTMHHIVSDGWSLNVLERELSAAYAAFSEGREPELAALPIQYGDYAAWQRQHLSGERLRELSEYWKTALGGAPVRLELPTDRPRPAEQDYAGGNLCVELDAALARAVRDLSRRHGVTPYMVVLAAWAVVLGRLSGQHDVVIGTPFAGRARPELEPLIGFFVDTLPIRVGVTGSSSVTELLAETKARVLAAQEHQALPLDQIVEVVQPPRSLSHAPLFQVSLAWQTPADRASAIGNLRATVDESVDTTAQFDLTLSLEENQGAISGSLNYATALYDRTTVERSWRYLVNVLRAMVSDDGQGVERLPILSAEERRGVLCGSAGRVEEYGLEECVQEVLERQVERAPEATAVIHGTRRISYGELNGRANRLARYLRRMGVGRGTRVGLCVGRGLEMVVGIVGTLKAGGAYVPLDPGYPRERLEYMVGDAEPSVILGQGLGLSVARELTANAVIDVGEEGEWGEESDANILVKETGQSSSQVAYVMYTSGSTGAPKGVMVEHRGLVNYTLDAMKWFGLCEGEVVFQQNSLNFDLSVEEVLPALASGATVVVSDEWFGLSMGKQPVRPTLVHLTAAHFHTLVSEWSRAPERAKEELAGVRLLNVTGDALSAEKVAQWEALRPAETQLINTYGPTEATVSCSATYVTHDPERGVTIGKPFANTQIYILDGERELLPVGVVGELYIGGEQVARGYWKRPELTAERFVRDPFSEKAGARMYRTGDLGRWLTNGEVEFLGRNDQQVKVRGFRIELGEVEARLSSAPGVGEVAVVVAKGEGAEKQVVAYYAGAEAPEAEVLRQYARQALPEYMVPSGMVRLEGLPQTPNGKIDRKALSERQSEGWSEVAREYEAPKGETERRVAGIWSEVLKVERVGRGDNFFELGGHSLLAVTLIERMRRAGLHTDVRTLLLSPTLAEVAGAMGGESGEVEVPPNGIPAGAVELRPEMLPLVKLSEEALERIVRSVRGGAENVQDVYPLAPLQEGILFHHLMEGEGDVYLEATLLGFDSRERVDGFLKALQTVVNRHDILRTAFLWEGLEEPVQVVVRQATLPVEELLLDAGNAAEELERRYDRRKYRIDVTEAPLLRCAVGEDREQGRWLVRLMTHHLATDHVSVELLMEEARRLMKEPSAELGEAAPFRNFVAQARLGEDEEAHGRFFREMLGDVEEPTAPFGLTGVYGDGVEIEESKQKLEGGLAKRLRAQARRRGVSAASVMHLAWAMVLSRVSGRRDVVFGTVLFGRMQGGKNADRTVGLLMNTLPVRLKLEEADAAQSVRTTHALLSELVRHEHARLSLAQRCSRIAAPAALFTALLNYRHSDGARESGELEWEGVVELGAEERSNYPLTLTVDDYGQDVALTAQVSADIGAARVCAYVAQAVENLVTALEADSRVAMCRIDVMPRDEREQVVRGFNTTDVEYGEAYLTELFEGQAARLDSAEAVACGQERVGYDELNRRANRLAHHLRSLGVGPDERVALCFERSVEMVVAVLGTLKAGGAYVPLDPAYPRERLEYMLEDSEPAVVLVHGATRELLQGCAVGRRVVDLDDATEWATSSEHDIPRAETGLRPEHLAYVIYTSGTTGQPKGAMNEHRGVVNRIRWMQERYGLKEGEAVIQKTPFSFDVSVWELLWPLTTGARLVMARPEGHRDPSYLREVIQGEQVTTAHFVPSMLQVFLEQESLAGCKSLSRVMCSGEALPAALAARFHARLPGVALHNLYGPTEAAVDVTAWACELGDTRSSVPIGKPIANTRIYVLDEWREPVPVGVVGEVYIAGVQVGRGYWKRPELTAARFVTDPFAEKPEARMYKTGDLARWLPEGALEYLGRNDHQVKVRGFRIELGEIESQLAGVTGISEVVVVARDEGSGDKRLVAYYTGKNAPAAEELRECARRALPEYMVPAAYVQLDALPLSANGKLDRRALPAPDHDALAVSEYEAPRGAIEEALAEIWSRVLKVDWVSRHDDFFALGGHSLLAVQVATQVEKCLSRKVSLGEVFARPVLRDLACALMESAPVDFTAIPVTERSGPLPLSPAQRRLWFLSQFEEASRAYHIHGAVRLGGALDGVTLRRALEHVVTRHEALRTRFVLVGGEPMQVVDGESRFDWREEELRGCADAESLLGELAQRENGAGFDLERGPLLRACLVRMREDEQVLLVTMHHIVSDGWSLNVLERELSAAYAAFSEGREPELAALPIQYGDYAAWQRQHLSGERLRELSEYWKTALGGAPVRLELPTDRPRPAEQDYAGGNLCVELDAALARAVRDLSRRHGVTPYMVVLAAWAAVLGRLSGQHDVVIGTPFAGRARPELEPLIGFFVDTLPIRVGVTGSSSVTELLAETKARVLAAQEHQALPLDQIVEVVQPPRSLSHAPLFQVSLAWQTPADRASAIGNLRATVDESVDTTAQFDLTLELDENGGRIAGALNYATALYDRATVARYWGYLLNALRAMVADDSQSLGRLALLNAPEREQVIHGFNTTDVEYGEAYLTELFEGQAARLDSAEAVACEQERVGYDELNRRANRLAHHLRSLGVGPDERVALCFERSVEMVVAVLGTLKAGGAYVPLDPAYPRERLEYMLEDSEPAVVLVHGATRELLQGCAVGRRVVDLDEAAEWATSPEHDIPRAETGLRPEHLAYVIYTSGTTGQPKGAMNEHRGVVNRIRWMQERYGLKEGEAVIQKTPFSFDVSVWELLWPLTTGARLVMARPEGHRDPSYLREVIQGEQVTTAHFVPSMLQVFLEQESLAGCKSLSRVMCSGEALPAALAARFHARLPGVALHNLYGPTEAAVDVTAWACELGDTRSSVPIGKPIANTRVYVLDEWREPVPVGVVGEVYIAGVQVGRGYWKRPELTAARFVTDPFAEKPEARMYKTGDLARWLPEGALEYLGRNDHQVKVRGFRIELGEIESQLAGVTGISEVVVVARDEGSGDKRLVAYYTGKNAPAAEELRECARRALPEYMVPAAYVQLDALPLSANGKLDRRALPAPDHDALAVSEYEAPRGAIEEALAEIWSRVLKVERIGRSDDFFALGGHSLLVVQVATQVEKCLSRKVSLGEVFARPVLRDLACVLMESAPVDFTAIPVTERSGPLPLSPAQRRLWFLSQFEEASRAYHIHGAVRLGGALDGVTLRRALEHVVTRHEALRTRFVLVGGEPMQVVDGESRFDWREEELRGRAGAENLLGELAQRENGAGFDLERGPLLRACLVRMREDEQVLLVTMHHIVSDGWSLNVLERELSAAYAAFSEGREPELAALPIQYGDYAAWQRQRLSGERLRELSEYWGTALAGAPVRLELPTDRPRPAEQSYAGANIQVEVGAAVARAVRELSRRHGVTPYMVVLAAWAVVLGRLSGQHDVVIGTPFAGRARPELEPLIGFFVNTLAVSVGVAGATSVTELLTKTKARVLAAQEHQELPLDRIVEVVQPPRSPSHSPLFQVALAWQSSAAGLSGIGEVRASVDDFTGETAQFDLTLSLEEHEGKLSGSLNYATALYDRETAERLWGYLHGVLCEMTRDESRTVGRLVMMSATERAQVIRDFNATEVEYGEASLTELFEAQAARRPHAEAVTCGHRRITFDELNRRANRLAHHLRSLGVGPDERVALCLERSMEMVVAVLGTLKAGGAYVPLDPAYPRERLRYMLEDSEPRVVLVHGPTRDQLDGGAERRRVVDLDEAAEWATSPEHDIPRAETGLRPEHLAYVIYTSGTTGQPKGAMNEHRGVVNRIRWMQERYGLKEGEAVIQKTPFSFDVSVWELLWPLTTGARLVMARPEGHRDPRYLRELIQAEQVTTAHFVPSMLQVFLEQESLAGCQSLSRVMCSGEALPAALAARFHARLPGVALHNLYGPTEAAVDVTAWACELGDTRSSVPIGKPIANTRIYVLDEWREPVPVGVVGEVYIAGVQVGRGYWKRPELTAERFVTDPFAEKPESRMYKTGDLARWLPDGALEYLGRNDHQVKVRGFRIELGEIEAQLAGVTGVSEVVVVARDEGSGDKRLVAYYTGKNAPAAEELRECARRTLPEYMVPAAYVQLDALPLSANGKLDRRALPAPDHGLAAREYEAPQGDVEEQLARIWAEVLKVERVGRHDNFFELGGHSLLAVQVAVRVERSAAVVLPLSEFFTSPTIATLAERVVEEQLAQFDAGDLMQLLSQKQ